MIIVSINIIVLLGCGLSHALAKTSCVLIPVTFLFLTACIAGLGQTVLHAAKFKKQATEVGRARASRGPPASAASLHIPHPSAASPLPSPARIARLMPSPTPPSPVPPLRSLPRELTRPPSEQVVAFDNITSAEVALQTFHQTVFTDGQISKTLGEWLTFTPSWWFSAGGDEPHDIYAICARHVIVHPPPTPPAAPTKPNLHSSERACAVPSACTQARRSASYST